MVCVSNRSEHEGCERKGGSAALPTLSRSTVPHLFEKPLLVFGGLWLCLSATKSVVTIMRKLDEQDRNDFKVRRIDTCAALNNVHDYSATAIKPACYNNAERIFRSTRDSQERWYEALLHL
jgi:predicted DNA repair protein MutK